MSIEPGRYRAVCTGAQDAQWGESQNGNTQLALVFKITEEGPAKGWMVSWTKTFTDNTIDAILESLETCGLEPGSELTELRGVDKNEVELVLEWAVDKDKNQLNFCTVAFINRPNSGRMRFNAPITTDQAKSNLRSFSAQWRARTPGTRKVGEPKRRQQEAPPTDPNHPVNQPTDDIPF